MAKAKGNQNINKKFPLYIGQLNKYNTTARLLMAKQRQQHKR